MHAIRRKGVSAVLGLIVSIGGGLLCAPVAQASWVSTDPCLPQHKYVKLLPTLQPAPPIVYAVPGGPTVRVDNVVHSDFTSCFAMPTGFDPATHQFSSSVIGTVDLGGGAQSFFDVFVDVTVKITRTTGSGPTGTFDTEMLQLDIGGGAGLPAGVMIRESPTLASLGGTSITDIGNGLYRIDSFFDIFTELTLDGGNQNPLWVPAQGPSHVELVPEPGVLGLLGIGLALLGVRSRRSR